jgi:ParB family chromosome partitioning protein
MEANRFRSLPIEKLVKADWNYKGEDEELQRTLEENIKRNGQIENIVVRELPTGFYEVVNGNHRLTAFSALGLKEVMVFDLGPISDSKARRIAVETNETKFKNDPFKLAEVIKEMTEEFNLEDLQVTMPFSASELESFTKLQNFDFDQYNSAEPEPSPQNGEQTGDQFETIEIRVPVAVAEQWKAQVQRVKKLLYPGENPDQVSIVLPFEAIVQVIAQTEDEQIA